MRFAMPGLPSARSVSAATGPTGCRKGLRPMMPWRMRARGATVVVSTHRTGLLQAVDKILLLRDGAIQLFDDRAKVLRPASAQAPVTPPAPINMAAAR